ncbi:prepilin-type N-terminal cleavage/methylation domain-containing protein [Pannus brasiliensis CCIBt3594]|uniref:Prepilin-type N-terminal cleavage/methylation domain-containing protein n=1 Tax=Pannus brasiliensis CCIBt3594 TaxID=1427578 RepID=A0AAW9QLJ9_9CHRO
MFSIASYRQYRRFSPRGVKGSESGVTLLELLITLVLLGILLAIGLSILLRLMAWTRLNIAASELAAHWRTTRYQAMGEGTNPWTLCMEEIDNEQLRHARIQGSNCEDVTDWQLLTRGVSIDEDNSTLRKGTGVAGNNGKIYRVSWADTRGGLGGSWGQLGRLTLIAPGTPEKKCLFLFDTDGSWNIREDTRCDR